MYSEKIFAQKLSKFLQSTISLFNNSENYRHFVFEAQNIINFGHPDDILGLYYFNNYFEIINRNKLIKNDNIAFDKSSFKTDLNSYLIKTYSTNHGTKLNISNFFREYGLYEKPLIDALYNLYEAKIKSSDEFFFIDMSKIFLLNSYDKQWQDICLKGIDIHYNKLLTDSMINNSLIYKLVEHLSEYDENNKLLQKLKNLPVKTQSNTKISKTQNNIGTILSSLGIKYISEYQNNYYTYDFFLPEYNTMIEYDGVDHFYPLQTQLKEKNKFRYKNITKKNDIKIIIIPYFEYCIFDTLPAQKYFIRRLINKKYNYFDGELFHENFDMLKEFRKEINDIRVKI